MYCASSDSPNPDFHEITIVVTTKDRIKVERQTDRECERTETQQHHWDILEMEPEFE